MTDEWGERIADARLKRGAGEALMEEAMALPAGGERAEIMRALMSRTLDGAMLMASQVAAECGGFPEKLLAEALVTLRDAAQKWRTLISLRGPMSTASFSEAEACLLAAAADARFGAMIESHALALAEAIIALAESGVPVGDD